MSFGCPRTNEGGDGQQTGQDAPDCLSDSGRRLSSVMLSWGRLRQACVRDSDRPSRVQPRSIDGSKAAAAAAMRFECGVTPPLTKGKALFNARRIHDDTRSASSDFGSGVDPAALQQLHRHPTQPLRIDVGTGASSSIDEERRHNHQLLAPASKGGVHVGNSARRHQPWSSSARTLSGPTRLSTALAMITAPVPSSGIELRSDRASCKSRKSRIGRGSSIDRCTTRERISLPRHARKICPGLGRPTWMSRPTWMNGRTTAVRRSAERRALLACGRGAALH